MNPFLRAHARPLLGSALLHAMAFVLIALTAWLTVTPKITPPASIDAYLARPPAPRPPAEPLTVKPDPVELPAPELPPTPAPLPAAKPVAAPPAPPGPQAAELLHKQAQAKEREREVARRAAETKQRAAAEAKQRAAAADKARKSADNRQREVREIDLKQQLEAEEHRLGAENAGLLGRYISELQARIERAWNRPPSAHTGLKCTLKVTQVPGGTVTDVRLGECNGDSAVQQSIVLAVYRASPLPAPSDPSLFDRHLNLVFEPHD